MDNKKINIKQYLKNFPNSKKVYIEGTKEDIRVPFRMIKQTSTKLNGTTETRRTLAANCDVQFDPIKNRGAA